MKQTLTKCKKFLPMPQSYNLNVPKNLGSLSVCSDPQMNLFDVTLKSSLSKSLYTKVTLEE